MTSDSPAKPFEWLSSGLFFGKSKDGIESVDSCRDPGTLLKGVDENLKQIQERGAAKDASETGTDANGDVKGAGANPSPSDFIAARLSRLRVLLYDERKTTSQQDFRRSNPTVAGSTVQLLVSESMGDLIPSLIENLCMLPFESRKHVAAVFNYLLVCGLEGSDGELYAPIMTSFSEYVESRFENILPLIVKGHECTAPGASDVALHCGSMYRSCFKHVRLYRQLVLTSKRVEGLIFPFLDTYVHVPDFDIASDAMESLRVVLTAGCTPQTGIDEITQQHFATLSAEFLTRDYDPLIEDRFNPKLMSPEANYMTKRVALQILSTILLTRSNYAVMIKYVNSRQNLILVMKLLRDTSPHITLDAFHVFKVFVANPSKLPDVEKILSDNKDKLCKYLQTLHAEKESTDTQFRDEKALIISTIQGL